MNKKRNSSHTCKVLRTFIASRHELSAVNVIVVVSELQVGVVFKIFADRTFIGEIVMRGFEVLLLKMDGQLAQIFSTMQACEGLFDLDNSGLAVIQPLK